MSATECCPGTGFHQLLQGAEMAVYFVIPSEASNPSSVSPREKKERFLASLGMTKRRGAFFAAYQVEHVRSIK